jgi:hypothetical protein
MSRARFFSLAPGSEIIYDFRSLPRLQAGWSRLFGPFFAHISQGPMVCSGLFRLPFSPQTLGVEHQTTLYPSASQPMFLPSGRSDSRNPGTRPNELSYQSVKQLEASEVPFLPPRHHPASFNTENQRFDVGASRCFQGSPAGIAIGIYGRERSILSDEHE